jgi:hypothetical protein
MKWEQGNERTRGAALSFGAYERPNKYPHHFSRYVGCASHWPGRCLLSLVCVCVCPYLPRDISAQWGFSVLCKLDGAVTALFVKRRV